MGDAADKVNREAFGLRVPRRQEDIALKELAEAVEQERMNGWMFSVTGAEWAERGQISVGQGDTIYVLNDVGLRFMGLLKEELLDVIGQLMLEDVAHESLADVGSAAFIA